VLGQLPIEHEHGELGVPEPRHWVWAMVGYNEPPGGTVPSQRSFDLCLPEEYTPCRQAIVRYWISIWNT
jgi:hypothetical protein